jgi:uridine kinase
LSVCGELDKSRSFDSGGCAASAQDDAVVNRPLIIGVVGGSGSGKTTVARAILESAGVTAAFLDQDAYYKALDHLSMDERRQVNFDHPDSLETGLLISHLVALKAGTSVEIPIYDFTTHRRKTQTESVHPTPIIVVEGILTFVDERLRNLFDLKIFVDTDADIRVFRRIRRDIEHRGRDFASIREQYYETVRPMHLMFVEPSKRWADVILPEGGENEVAIDLIIGKVRSMLGMGTVPPPAS